MVIVTVSLESEGETEMLDIMLAHQRDYKLFCTGTIESIARICGVNCSNCHEGFQESPVASNNGELFVMFALESKAETFELLCSLTETGLTKVQTSDNIISFLNSKEPVCTTCKQRAEQQHVFRSPATCNSTLTSLFNIDRPLFYQLAAPLPAVSERTLQSSQTIVHRLLRDLAALNAPSIAPVKSQPMGVDEVNDVKPLVVHGIANHESREHNNRSNNNNNVELMGENRPRKEYPCQVCGRIFVTGMQQHAKIHVSRLPIKCRKCDHECRYRQQIESHFNSHHAGQRVAFIDMSSHADYLKEVNVKTRECFPNWAPQQNKGRGRGRPKGD